VSSSKLRFHVVQVPLSCCPSSLYVGIVLSPRLLALGVAETKFFTVYNDYFVRTARSAKAAEFARSREAVGVSFFATTFASARGFRSLSSRNHRLKMRNPLYLDVVYHRPGTVLDKSQIHFARKQAVSARRNDARIVSAVKVSLSLADLVGLARQGWHFTVRHC
jgi:hypothetical protein